MFEETFLLDIEVVTQAEDFLALESAWRALADAEPNRSVFVQWEWAYHWWRIFLRGESTRLRVFVLRSPVSGELVGIAPFYLAGEVGAFQKRIWRLFGDAGRLAQGMTEEPVFLFRSGRGSDVVATIDSYLRKNQGAFDYVSVRLMLPDDSGVFPQKPSPLPATYRRVSFKGGSAQMALAPSWAAFRKSVSRSMRDNLSYYPRLLERNGHAFEVTFAESPEAIPEAVAELVRLHRHRAQFKECSVPHVDHMPFADHERFLTDLFTDLVETQRVFVAVLRVDGEAIAAQAFFVNQSRLTFYYSGFNTDWQKFSPLLVLAKSVIERAIAARIEIVDFLPGKAVWKERWGAVPHGCLHEIRYTRTTPLSLVRSATTMVAHRIAWARR